MQAQRRSRRQPFVSQVITLSIAAILAISLLPGMASAAPSRTIQQMVDQAAAGSTITVPAGVYRETVNVNKPLTLLAQPGAEIRGSDDWSGSGWNASGGRWTSSKQVPNFSSYAREAVCDGSDRCKWPEQVFIDGQPLTQVASNPNGMQFSINSSRQVVLGTDPSGRFIEVTTREYWLTGTADNVTVDGFTMTHAATPYQHGALNNGERSNWTIRNNTLSHAHAANVSIYGGTNLQLLNNTIHNGGGLGVHGWNANGSLVQGNRVWGNNTEKYDMFWEAGGMKISESRGTTIANNHVSENNGMGIWVDVFSENIEISGNQVSHNSAAGITHELSSRGRITGNNVWENGHDINEGPGGSGIFVQESRDTEIRDNVVAWNGAGIVMFADNRGVPFVNNLVSNNDVFVVSHKPWDVHGLAWRQWDGDTSMAAPGANNRSENNRFYHANPANSSWNTFVWIENYYDWNGLDQFNHAAGHSGNSYMNDDVRNSSLASAGVPTSFGTTPAAQPSPVQAEPVATVNNDNPLLSTHSESAVFVAFQDFWHRNGGLPVFGYPLTDAFEQVNPDSGQIRTVQYMERQRFEHHPELAGSPYEVMIGRLGVTHAEQRGLLGTEPFQRADQNNSGDNCRYFEETGHNVCGSFLNYWRSHGLDMGDAGVSYRESLALFGLPISEPFVDPATGLTSQFFERAIFEYHAGNAGTQYEVLLVRLGAEAVHHLEW